MRKPFNPLQAAILKALTEALFHGAEMAIPSTQVVDNLQHQFAAVKGGKPREIGLSLYLVCFLALGGPLFLLLGPAWGARRIERRLRRSTNNLLQDLARIRGVVYAGYYGHWTGKSQRAHPNPVLRQLDFELPADRNRDPGKGEVPIVPFPGRDLTHGDMLGPHAAPDEAEVVVIGSGAGGAVAAANLAAQGYDVLIVEAGPLFASPDITHQESAMTARLFVDGGLQSSRDHDVVVFQGRCVGGSTVINNGICLRVKEDGGTHPAAPDVLATWSALGAPVDEARFAGAYGAVAARLSIQPIERIAGRNNGGHLLRGWAAHAAGSGDPRDRDAPALWFSKNYGPKSIGAACAYCGYCNTGCPYGRKQGMAQSYLLDARDRGARILPETAARRIRWRAAQGDRRKAEAVEVTLADGRRHVIRARRGVVVAAGALASSRLLADSGVRGAGTGVSLNIACPVLALMPDEMRSWDEDQMATYVDRGDFLLESHFQPPMSMAAMMPGWGVEHVRRMRRYGRLASAGVLFPADRLGRLVDGKLRLKLGAAELRTLRRALATLSRVHFAAGAQEVYPAVARGLSLRPGQDPEAFFDRWIREADDVTLSSSHPQGGNARNADPARGVVDLDCRLHGAANVLVTDASVFTSCIRVNAQMTTMAMAHYATAGRGL